MADDDEIPSFTIKNSKTETCQIKEDINKLYKLWITDLLHIPVIDSYKSIYKFKEHDVRLIMCSGIVRRVIADSTKISFTVDDGTGTIQCFYKLHPGPDTYHLSADNLPENNIDDSCFEESSITSLNNYSLNETIVKCNNLAEKEVYSWFQKCMEQSFCSTSNICQVDDIVHVIGYLFQLGNFRRCQAVDIRVVNNWNEEIDHLLELCHLYDNVY